MSVTSPHRIPSWCVTGWPLPNVTWWRGSKMVDGGWEVSGPRLVRNDLVVSKLTRDWHNDTLTCIASNTKLVPPHSVSATIQMYRKCGHN